MGSRHSLSQRTAPRSGSSLGMVQFFFLLWRLFTVTDTARQVFTVMDTARQVFTVMDTAREVFTVMDTAREVFTVMDLSLIHI